MSIILHNQETVEFLTNNSRNIISDDISLEINNFSGMLSLKKNLSLCNPVYLSKLKIDEEIH